MKLYALIILAGAVIVMLIWQHGGHSPHNPVRASEPDLIVSSAADAGPGTLRDAILAADRSADSRRIVVKVPHIALDTALPALINPQGISIDGAAGTVIDASSQGQPGATLQIKGNRSALHQLTILHAHDLGILITATGVSLDAVTVNDSRIGITVAAGADGLNIRNARFEDDDTGITGDIGIRNLVVTGSVFRRNSRAAMWFVGTADSHAPTKTDAGRANLADDTFEENKLAAVFGNRSVMIEKSHFLKNSVTAILVLSGGAELVDNDIRQSGEAAISVTSGTGVRILRNLLADNRAAAIMLRDSTAEIEHNILNNNAYGIVCITGADSVTTSIQDNVLTGTAADAITVIGGSPLVARNEVTGSRGAAIRLLDWQEAGVNRKAQPKFDANIMHANLVDTPLTGVYKAAANPSP